MKRYKQVYMDFFGLSPDERIPCEWCHKEVAVDIHHCQQRGMGGDPTGSKDVIENLIGVCRKCHDLLEAVPEENDNAKSYCTKLDYRKEWMRRMLFRGC